MEATVAESSAPVPPDEGRPGQHAKPLNEVQSKLLEGGYIGEYYMGLVRGILRVKTVAHVCGGSSGIIAMETAML